jgi:hypothetical protein
LTDSPQTPQQLRARCQDWPADTVRVAVLRILVHGAPASAQSEALATLLASWLIGDDDGDAPPLNAWSIQAIWDEMRRQVQ